MSAAVRVRPFARADIPRVLELMRGLALFEAYIDDFKVTPQDLEQYGLGPNPRFQVFVALRELELSPPGESAAEKRSERIDGIAVVYEIPWTYDLKPTLILKELFVDDAARGHGIGKALMGAVARHAKAAGCPRVAWTVLKTNVRGAAFYSGLGARKDVVWDAWSWNEAAIERVSARAELQQP